MPERASHGMLERVRFQLLCGLFALAACGGGASRDVRAPVTNHSVVEEKRARPRLTLEGALAMMPADTEMVLELDVARLRTSILWERIEPWLRAQGGETLDEVQQLCNFDPIAKLDTMLVGVRGIGRPEVDATMFVRGYDQDASVACLERAGEKARATGEDTSVVVAGDSLELRDGTTASLVILFVDPRTALMVTRAGVFADRAALEVVAAAKPGDGLTSSPSFDKVLGRINTHATAWFAMNGNSPLFATMPYHMRAIRGEFHAGADAARAVVGTVIIEFDNNGDATSTGQMFRMAIDTLKGGPYDDVSRAVTVTEEGHDVVIEMRFDLAQLERMFALAGPAFP